MDSDNSKVGHASDPMEQIKRIYQRVRNDVRYEPASTADPSSYRASTLRQSDYGSP